MRDRIVATGLLFTLLLVGLAGLAGCGSSSSKSSSSSSGSSGSSGGGRGVTLSLLGGTGNLNAVACGKQEPFEDYSAPAQVRYTGTVSPAPAPGRWKVKLKLKQCRGGSFVDVSSQKIVGQPSGRFDGVFPVAKPGSYSLRAKLEGAGGNPESPKVYLQLG